MAPSVILLSVKDLERSSSFPLFLIRRNKAFGWEAAGNKARESARRVLAESREAESTERRKELELMVRRIERLAELVAGVTLD
jgi:hypothetical protein